MVFPPVFLLDGEGKTSKSAARVVRGNVDVDSFFSHTEPRRHGEEKDGVPTALALRHTASRTEGPCVQKLTQSDPTAPRAGAFMGINGIL